MMKFLFKSLRFLSLEAWAFIGLTALSLICLSRWVDLTPHVEYDFFFSTEDPTYKDDTQITQLFPRRDSQIIISAAGDIFSKEYQEKIRYFSEILMSFDMVSSVKSISSGPSDVKDAIRSPLWNRILVNDNLESTNILALVDEAGFEKIIPKIENLISTLQDEDFQIRISGFPYIVELIRRNLKTDLNTFSSLALVLFAAVAIFIFHSWTILIGIIVTCACSYAMTFLISGLIGLKIGVLTANLATIIFVMTLSHIVFLTFNWKNFYTTENPHGATDEAMELTLPASFWAMATTLLGFLSLLFVNAQPLRELGISGSFGTAICFICTYSIYPAFLRLTTPKYFKSDVKFKQYHEKLFDLLEKSRYFIIIGILGVILWTVPSLRNLNTDPSLISYFSPKSEITKGLEYIDHNGGSSPLVLVLRSTNGEKLNSNKIYRRLWALQEDLESHPDVGTIVSLPTLLAEGKRVPFSFLFTSEWLLSIMDLPVFDRIGRSFITKDRQYGLFLLRMNELDRTKSRVTIIEEIREIVRRHGFDPYLTGGIYALQGHLSQHIEASLIRGLSQLILTFAVIAFIVSGSLQTGISMTLSISLIPLFTLGLVGKFHIPVDTVSAPAANVAIGMGIDSMIHMTNIYRRQRKKGLKGREGWLLVRRQMSEPILTAMVIISAGFAIFLFSSFPPTQRFGVSIVLGTIVSALGALFIFPLLASKK